MDNDMEISVFEEGLTPEERIRMKKADDYAEKFITQAENAAEEYGSTAFLRRQFETYDLVEKFFHKANALEEKITQFETDVHYKTYLAQFDNIYDYASFMQKNSNQLASDLDELSNLVPQIKHKIEEGLAIAKQAERIITIRDGKITSDIDNAMNKYSK